MKEFIKCCMLFQCQDIIAAFIGIIGWVCIGMGILFILTFFL